MTVPPPPLTPPSTAPTSPTNTISQNGDFIIDFGNLPVQQQNYDEKKADNGATELIEGPSKETLHSRVSGLLSKARFSNALPHIPWRGRKSDGREKLVQRIDDHPEGYPQLAAFVNSDENFLMCRRFGFLHTRVMLYRQDELASLERQLVLMDEEDVDLDPLALKSRDRDDQRPEQPSRKSLIQIIDDKLKEYDDLVMRMKSLVSLKEASTRNYNSFTGWILDQKPLTIKETEFIKHKEDFVALADGEELGWFDGFVEDMLTCLPHGISKRIFSDPELRLKSDDTYVHLYSKYRIDVLVRLTLTILAVALLMAPTVVLFLVEATTAKIVVILLFTLFFSAALSVFTKAKRHEMFAATAA